MNYLSCCHGVASGYELPNKHLPRADEQLTSAKLLDQRHLDLRLLAHRGGEANRQGFVILSCTYQAKCCKEELVIWLATHSRRLQKATGANEAYTLICQSSHYHLAWERRLIVRLGSFLLPNCAQTVIRLDRIVIGLLHSGSIMDHNNPVSDSFPFLFPRHSKPYQGHRASFRTDSQPVYEFRFVRKTIQI